MGVPQDAALLEPICGAQQLHVAIGVSARVHDCRPAVLVTVTCATIATYCFVASHLLHTQNKLAGTRYRCGTDV